MKKGFSVLIMILLISLLAGCGKKEGTPTPEPANDKIVVGFSQLGAESDWRSANTKSMKETFTAENGFELIFDDGQQKQSNQITAIRKFIQQQVDYIVLAPVTETGWDTVLQEAKDAGIPVIIVDRMVDVKNQNLFSAHVGSDFELEGKKMTAWLKAFIDNAGIKDSDLHIVNIQGNIGATAQIGRTKGLEDACALYGWDLLDEVPGEFTQAKGREVMESFLNKYKNINVVYCENDNSAFGAIEAIEAAGFTVGSDIANGQIMVLSFDGVSKTAIELAASGKITCIAECNPLHGPRIKAIIDALQAGQKPEKEEYVNESFFSADTSVTEIVVDSVKYVISKPEL